MTVITISRGSASGGMELARRLAERLGYEIVSREDIVHEAARFGVSEARLREAILKPLGFWDRFKRERTRYITFIQAALREHASKDDLVYHGNAGHLLLRGVSHVLRIRLIAPAAYRIRQLKEREGMTEEEAARHIERVDRQRRDWTHFLYGIDPLDPALYDLTLNLEHMDMDSAVELAAAAAGRPEFQATEESRRQMADLVLAGRVQAALAADERTAGVEVKVRAEGGVVHLKGRVYPAALVSTVVETAARVEGVRGVNRQDLDSPDVLV